jgi:hypothetical protein
VIILSNSTAIYKAWLFSRTAEQFVGAALMPPVRFYAAIA